MFTSVREVWGPEQQFVTCWSICDEEFLASRPTPKLEIYPFTAFHEPLLNIFSATLVFIGHFLYPQHEDAPGSSEFSDKYIMYKIDLKPISVTTYYDNF
jgi:hypothetical protein